MNRSCACGREAIVRLRYEDERGREVRTDPKCMRCADRAAFPALQYRTDRVSAERLRGVDSTTQPHGEGTNEGMKEVTA